MLLGQQTECLRGIQSVEAPSVKADQELLDDTRSYKVVIIFPESVRLCVCASVHVYACLFLCLSFYAALCNMTAI